MRLPLGRGGQARGVESWSWGGGRSTRRGRPLARVVPLRVASSWYIERLDASTPLTRLLSIAATTRPKRSKAPPAPTSDNERSPEPEDPEEEEQDEVDEISEEEEEDDDDFSEDEAPKKKGRAAKGKAGAKKAAPKKAAPRKRTAKKAVVDGEEEEEHIGGTGDTLVAEDNAIYSASCRSRERSGS